MELPFISRKRYNEKLSGYSQRIDAQKEKIGELKKENDINLNLANAVKKIVDKKGNVILKLIEADNNWHILHLLVTKNGFDEIEIDLYISIVTSGVIWYSEASLNAVFNDDGVFISEIETKKINQGYGTVLVNELISICRLNKVKRISGNLICDDLKEKDRIEHGNRLTHFYSKLGFVITEDKRGKHIGLDLK